MNNKYTQAQKKEIYQEFMRTGKSYNELAKKHMVSKYVVKRAIEDRLKARMKKPEEEYSTFKQMKSLIL